MTNQVSIISVKSNIGSLLNCILLLVNSPTKNALEFCTHVVLPGLYLGFKVFQRFVSRKRWYFVFRDAFLHETLLETIDRRFPEVPDGPYIQLI
jgi:hypothetical protein